MASKWTRVSGRGTIHSMEIWEGDRRPTSISIDGADHAPSFAPDVVLWADADHGVVVGQDVLMPDAPPQALAESLRKAIGMPVSGSGAARLPRLIRVKRPELADVLRPVTEALGIKLEVSESLPLVDDLFRILEVRFGTPSNQGYLEATEVPEALLQDFFAAAAALYRSRPWRSFAEGDAVLLECEDWVPGHRYVTITGSNGGIKGFALYQSGRDLMRLGTMPPEDPRSEKLAWRTPAVALLYTQLSALGPRRVQEVRSHGWDLASRNAYPLAVGTGRGRESHWPTVTEIRMLTTVVRVLIGFAKPRARARSLPVAGLTVTESYEVSVGDETAVVQATFPAPVREP